MTEPESRREGSPARRGSPDGDRPVGGHLETWAVVVGFVALAVPGARIWDLGALVLIVCALIAGLIDRGRARR